MRTDIPVGSWVCYSNKGKTEYAQVSVPKNALGILTPPEKPKVGTFVHRCVWVNRFGESVLEGRRAFIYRG